MIDVISKNTEVDADIKQKDINTVIDIMEKKYEVVSVGKYNEALIKEADIPEETKGIYKDILRNINIVLLIDGIFFMITELSSYQEMLLCDICIMKMWL